MKAFIVRVFKGKRAHLFIQWAETKAQAMYQARNTWFPAPENTTDVEAEEILQGVNKPLGQKVSENERNFTCFCPNCKEFHQKSMPESEFLGLLDQNPQWNIPEVECQGCVDFGNVAKHTYPDRDDVFYP